MPDLDFRVLSAEVLPYAAAPTVQFKLEIKNAVEAEPIHSVLLRTQIRIEATRRRYDTEEEGQLLELFGMPQQWKETLKSLFWTHTTTVIPGFTGSVVADLPVACTYDFEVTAAKYLHALQDGDVPLLFLFSGTVFYPQGEGGLQIAQIPWEKEASFRLPVCVWKETMDRYFPNSAWLRVRKDVFDRLYHYKVHHALPTWEEALERLLQAGERER